MDFSTFCELKTAFGAIDNLFDGAKNLLAPFHVRMPHVKGGQKTF